jgi:hypothetical protein
VFGAVSQLVAGIVPAQAPIGTHPGAPSSNASSGLEITFLVMLVALFAAGWFLFRARATFANDVATAAASEPGANFLSDPPAPDDVAGQGPDAQSSS